MSNERPSQESKSPDDQPSQSDGGGQRKSLRGRLTSAAFWSIFGRVLSIGAFFCTQLLLGRLLSKPDYAAYVVVSAAVALSTMLISFGTPQILIRTIRHKASVSQAVLSCLKIVLLFSCVATLVLSLGSGWLGEERKWSGLRDHNLWIAVWFCLSAACLVASSALQAMDDFRSAVLVGAKNGGLIPNVLFLVLLVVAARSEPLSDLLNLRNVIALRALLQIATVLPAAVFVLRAFLRQRASEPPTKPQGPAQPAPTMAWFAGESWYLMVTQLVVLGLTEFDVLLVGSFVKDNAVADYGAAKTLIGIVRAPLLMAGIFVGPFIAELYHQQQLQRLSRLLRGAATIIGIPALLLLAAFTFLPTTIVAWTFGEAYLDAAPLLRVLTLGQVVFVLTGCNAQALTMTGHQRELMMCSLITLIAYVALAPWAISHWGVLGGAWANTLLVACQNLLVTLMVRVKVKIWTTASPSYPYLRQALLSIAGKPTHSPPQPSAD